MTYATAMAISATEPSAKLPEGVPGLIAPQLLRIPAPANENGGVASAVVSVWWRALVVQPGSERKTADTLIAVSGVPVYLPTFVKQERAGGSNRRHQRARRQAVVPGLVFAPDSIETISRRDEVFNHAHVHGFLHSTAGQVARLRESEIDCIREIERKLNATHEARKPAIGFILGQVVRFASDLFDTFWGTATILEIASPTRIGVEVRKLFGCPTMVYVPASEIEPL